MCFSCFLRMGRRCGLWRCGGAVRCVLRGAPCAAWQERLAREGRVVAGAAKGLHRSRWVADDAAGTCRRGVDERGYADF